MSVEKGPWSVPAEFEAWSTFVQFAKEELECVLTAAQDRAKQRPGDPLIRKEDIEHAIKEYRDICASEDL